MKYYFADEMDDCHCFSKSDILEFMELNDIPELVLFEAKIEWGHHIFGALILMTLVKLGRVAEKFVMDIRLAMAKVGGADIRGIVMRNLIKR